MIEVCNAGGCDVPDANGDLRTRVSYVVRLRWTEVNKRDRSIRRLNGLWIATRERTVDEMKAACRSREKRREREGARGGKQR